MRLRSLLFTPGNVQKMLDKGTTSGAHVQILDLEDSVPSGEPKKSARINVAKHLEKSINVERRPLFCVRVNHTKSLLMDDLEAVVQLGIWGISIPKTENKSQIEQLCETLTRLENSRGLETNSIRILPWIETALGLHRAHEVAMASERVAGLFFGADDFRADMGIERIDDSESTRSDELGLIQFARLQVALAARSARVASWDTPCAAVRGDWQPRLAESIRIAKEAGMTGNDSL